MTLFEDALKNHPLALAGLGVVVLAAPSLFPSLRPQWAFAMKEGAKLLLEANGEAEADLIESLSEFAVQRLVQAVSAPPGTRDERIGHVLSKYKARARRRSNRWGGDAGKRESHYRAHLAQLRRKALWRQARDGSGRRDAWDEAIAQIDAA